MTCRCRTSFLHQQCSSCSKLDRLRRPEGPRVAPQVRGHEGRSGHESRAGQRGHEGAEGHEQKVKTSNCAGRCRPRFEYHHYGTTVGCPHQLQLSSMMDQSWKSGCSKLHCLREPMLEVSAIEKPRISVGQSQDLGELTSQKRRAAGLARFVKSIRSTNHLVFLLSFPLSLGCFLLIDF